MAQQANIVQEGVDRFRDAFGSVEGEFERIQKQLRARRRSLEKQLKTMKQIERWRKDATKQLEQGVDNILGALKIASKSDVQRIDRKISQINRKMKEIERRKRSNGQAAA
jgi:archaellum component FlaC